MMSNTRPKLSETSKRKQSTLQTNNDKQLALHNKGILTHNMTLDHLPISPAFHVAGKNNQYKIKQ